jgi:secondary thiamine-phosphate synthase enzyme
VICTDEIRISTRGQDDLRDLTGAAQQAVERSGLAAGVATLFVIGSTAALTTIEFEPGLAHDFPAALERIAPANVRYEHEERWHDDNGHSHVRASLIGPSLSVPFVAGKLVLGTWQQIVLLECDTRARDRTVVVQMVGE